MRADRLISLLLLLQTRGQMTARELAERLEVSERTIYRDLEALSVAGIPVYTERGPHGGIALLDDYRTTLTGLNEAEVRALFTAIVVDLAADLGSNDALRQAVLKLMAALPRGQQHHAEAVRNRIFLDPAGWFQREEPVPFLALMQQAMWERRRARIVYRRGDGAWIRRLIAPYGLVAKASIWYVVTETRGPLDRDGMPRKEPLFNVYRVSRIQEATLTEASFERWPDFDLPAFWASWRDRFERGLGGYPVRLRVHLDQLAALAPVFGEGIHQLVAQAGSPDIEGFLTLALTFADLPDARRALAGLGPIVQVESPPELQRELVLWGRQLQTHFAASQDTP